MGNKNGIKCRAMRGRRDNDVDDDVLNCAHQNARRIDLFD